MKKNKNKEHRKPGEPPCKTERCAQLRDALGDISYKLDKLSLYISGAEAGVAGVAYAAATAACLGTGVGCGAAYVAAFKIDVGAATALGSIEDTSGWLSFSAVAANDWLSGNTGIDKEIGPYVGKDTVVTFRNSAIGSIPESFLDLAVSASQLNYDEARLSGEKQGGYVPFFSLEIVSQMLFEDW